MYCPLPGEGRQVVTAGYYSTTDGNGRRIGEKQCDPGEAACAGEYPLNPSHHTGLCLSCQYNRRVLLQGGQAA